MKWVRVQGHQTEDEEIIGVGIIRLNLDKLVAYWKIDEGYTRLDSWTFGPRGTEWSLAAFDIDNPTTVVICINRNGFGKNGDYTIDLRTSIQSGLTAFDVLSGDGLQYTQFGGVRPWGCALFFIGIDASGPQIFTTSPSGIYRPFKAYAIGTGEANAREYLQENYIESMTFDSGSSFKVESIDLMKSQLTREGPVYTRLSSVELM